jgi:hypothetical protein
MKRLRTFASLALLVVATAASAATHGAWTATRVEDGTIQLLTTTGGWQNWGRSYTLAELGFPAEALTATTSTPVAVTLKREAGSITLEGSFKNGDGAGHFEFTPNRAYLTTLKSMGMSVDELTNSERTEDDVLFSFAMMDLSTDYIREMRGIFAGASLREIRKARAVNVTSQYVKSMRAAGIAVDDLNSAAKLAAVEVTPEYVRSLRAAGVEVRDARDASKLRAVNVTPELVNELAAAGYKNLTAHDLAKMAAVGVDGKFIREMSKYHDKH